MLLFNFPTNSCMVAVMRKHLHVDKPMLPVTLLHMQIMALLRSRYVRLEQASSREGIKAGVSLITTRISCSMKRR